MDHPDKGSSAVALVDLWLATATDKLCDQATARIATEVKAHYCDLVEAHIAEGALVVDARLKAFEDLGEPKEAARKFRKHHLTKDEERMIFNLLKSPQLALNLLAAAFLIFALTLFPPSGIRMIEMASCLFVFVILPLSALLKARRANTPARISKVLVWDIVVTVAVGSFYFTFFGLIYRSPGFLGYLPSLCLASNQFFCAFHTYRLLKKFRRQSKTYWTRSGAA